MYIYIYIYKIVGTEAFKNQMRLNVCVCVCVCVCVFVAIFRFLRIYIYIYIGSLEIRIANLSQHRSYPKSVLTKRISNVCHFFVIIPSVITPFVITPVVLKKISSKYLFSWVVHPWNFTLEFDFTDPISSCIKSFNSPVVSGLCLKSWAPTPHVSPTEVISSRTLPCGSIPKWLRYNPGLQWNKFQSQTHNVHHSTPWWQL